MHFLPVAMSIMVSFLSPLSILGRPSEMFAHGINYIPATLSCVWSLPMISYLFVPVFKGLKLTSSYEYMELRFNFALRIIVALIFMVQSTVYMAVCLLGPALAIQAVQGIEVWQTIIVTGFICCLYTTLGGMKGVIWTDVFQFFVIFGTVVAVIVIGVIQAGGFEEVFRINDRNGRLEMSFSLDPTARLSVLSTFIGGGINYAPLFTSQTAVQRYMTVKSLKQSQMAVLMTMPFLLIILGCLYLSGLVLYAVYNSEFFPYWNNGK
ncbi:putative sodium-dependent multivitamin transporter [Ptychodera flava]|uniref:putative sodium-dependent multivitamin transporter n=1 Tax=Ptychodera flava TaxID=63121 RepID=UPI00396A1637